MYLADTLSRAYLKETSDTSNTTDKIESINMIDELPISEERISELTEHTTKDQQMQELKEVIQEGWPSNKWNVPSTVSIYFDIRDELTLQNGLLFKGERVIIPKSLRTDMIKNIHSSHIGIEGCLRRANISLYWPGMNAEVKYFIQRCETCLTFERKQHQETLISHEIPNHPWSKVGIDLMTFQSKNYLVTVDYYSNYWEVDYLEDTLVLTVIRDSNHKGKIEIDTQYTYIIMASPSNTDMKDLKTLILAVDSKVNKFNEKLDTIKNKFSNLVQEVKQHVTQVKLEFSKTG
ncbi:unnamed protein product [Mytilus edulis]|uniref:Integrase zinc-binding domain-containing protein n=1 Tax=Mytilus edulis TaxID=6550 RepID=A0A8S3RY73_MYTED|nr:unnamed protein product [Mytilus edulis]